MKRKILAFLLHNANRSVPFLHKEAFYRIKTKILTKHGIKTGQEVQHIIKECNRCNGTGIFVCGWKQPEPCMYCNDGIYSQFWTLLDKYRLGRYEFHHPIKKVYSPGHIPNLLELKMIKGYIEHTAPKHHIGRECALWLFLFYDIKTFIKDIKAVGVKKGRSPLVIIGNCIFILRHLPGEIRRWNNLKRIKKEAKLVWYSPERALQEDLPF